jgi:hypothetical protein
MGYGIDLDLLGLGNKFADDNRVFVIDLGGDFQTLVQFFVRKGNTHGRAAEHITGPDQNRIADFSGECFGFVNAGRFLPWRLTDL